MEEVSVQPEEQAPQFPENSCQNCGNPRYEEGYVLKLCTDCRNTLSSLTFPKWLQFTFFGVVGIFLIALYLSKDSFFNFINYKKAENAYNERNFETARHYYSLVKVKDYDKNIEIQSKILMCHYYAYRMDSVVEKLKFLYNKSFEDASLLSMVEHASNQLSDFFPQISDTIYPLLDSIPVDSLTRRENFLNFYLTKNPGNLNAIYALGDIYYDQKQYAKAIELLKLHLNNNYECQPLVTLLAACYRELKQFDEAVHLSNSLLAINHESISGYSTLSKIELKRKNDGRALEYAEKAMAIDSNDYVAIGAMALAAHFNKMEEKCQSCMKKYLDITQDTASIKYYNTIMSATSDWRN